MINIYIYVCVCGSMHSKFWFNCSLKTLEPFVALLVHAL